MAGPTTLFQSGDHASRPAASSGCVLYWCTDHELFYLSNGSAWSTWADLSVIGGAAAFAGVRAVQSTNTNLTNGSLVYLGFNAADEYDTDAFHDPAANNTRLTVPAGKAGKYAASGFSFTTASPGEGFSAIRKNGTTIVTVGPLQSTANFGVTACSTTLDLAVGDYLEFGIRVGAASKQSLDAGAGAPTFEMHKVG